MLTEKIALKLKLIWQFWAGTELWCVKCEAQAQAHAIRTKADEPMCACTRLLQRVRGNIPIHMGRATQQGNNVMDIITHYCNFLGFRIARVRPTQCCNDRSHYRSLAQHEHNAFRLYSVDVCFSFQIMQ